MLIPRWRGVYSWHLKQPFAICHDGWESRATLECDPRVHENTGDAYDGPRLFSPLAFIYASSSFCMPVFPVKIMLCAEEEWFSASMGLNHEPEPNGVKFLLVEPSAMKVLWTTADVHIWFHYGWVEYGLESVGSVYWRWLELHNWLTSNCTLDHKLVHGIGGSGYHPNSHI